MEKIRSFQIDHTRLDRGLYVSRIDAEQPNGGHIVTTFDIRVCKPYSDAPMDAAAIHTIEHIGATFLRTESFFSESTIYFGPMGCQTGFYLIIGGNHSVDEVKGTVKEMFSRIAVFDGTIPGSSETECGNASFHNLPEARRIAHKYYNEVLCSLDKTNTIYPR